MNQPKLHSGWSELLHIMAKSRFSILTCLITKFSIIRTIYIINWKHKFRLHKQLHLKKSYTWNDLISQHKVSIGSCQSPYRLSWIPLACTCDNSIAKKVLQLIHNIDCRIVERQFILISIFGARPKSCSNLLCFVQWQAIYFCVCHTKVASHHHIWHDFVIPTMGKTRTTT